MDNIKIWWQEGQVQGSKIFCFVSKLKMVKEKILKWNKAQFNNIFKEKLDTEEKLEKLNKEVIIKGMNNKTYLQEKKYLLKQEEILAKEEVFWKQKSREKWLAEGDHNTKYFHTSALQHKATNNISKIKDIQGNSIDNPIEIIGIFVDYFKDILNNYESSNQVTQGEMLKAIPKVITIEDNKSLNKPFSLQEIKTTLFNINPDKSPGLDGFQAFFFQKCSEIIGVDLWKAIEVSRNGGKLLAKINHTFLTLIPKKSKAKEPGDFKPIALCNTIYNFFSKALAN